MKKTIAYLTDTHLDEPGPGKHGANERKNWERALSELDTLSFDQIIFGGDIGEFSAYPDFFKSLSYFPELRVTPGNHDTSAHVRQFFRAEFHHSESGFYYGEEDDALKWIFLDSSTDKISPEQMQWLETELSNSDKEIILFIHHPILAVNTPADHLYPLENRDAVSDLLRGYEKQVTIFCGHYHIEDEVSDGNIRQYVTPAISYQIKKGTAEMEGDATYFAYRMIYIDGNKIETEVVTLYPDEF